MRSDAETTGGWVYLLTNESMPGIVKIGMTTRCVDQRAKELSASTSAPTPFKVAHRWPVHDPMAVEAVVHRKLRSRRVNQRREFFRVDSAHVVQMMTQIIDENGGLCRGVQSRTALVFAGALFAAIVLIIVLALFRPDLVFGGFGLILLFAVWRSAIPPRRSKRKRSRSLRGVFGILGGRR